MAAFVPTKLNQAGLDSLKQSFQGVTLSNVTPVAAQGVTPAPQDPAAQYKAAANAYTASHWTNGTANGQTPAQNLAAVINQPGNPVAANPTPFITNTLNQAAKDTASQVPKPQGTFNPPSAAGDSPAQPPMTPVAASNYVPAPASQGSYPGQLSSAQIAAEAQARIDKQRAAITSATAAANAARKNVFDYTNQITGDSRTLENGAFNETHNPFTGQTGYAQANLQRNRTIQDTANNNNYQADITANNQKVTDFETLAPEQQQAILDQLTRQERDYGLQVGALTGQFNGQNTMQQNQNNFNNGIAQGSLTGNYTGPVGSQGQGVMFAQGSPNGQNNQASDMAQFNANQSAYSSASPQQQQALHQQNTDIASRYGGQYNSQTGQWSFPQNGNTGIGGGLNQSQGVRTLAGQNQDFNQMANNRDFAYQQSRDLIKDKQYQQTFDQNNKQFGLDYAIKQATLANQITNDQAQRAIGWANEKNSSKSISNSNDNMKQDNLMNIWKATGKAPAGITGVAEGTPYAQAQSTNLKSDKEISDLLDSSPFVTKQLDDNGKVIGTTVSDANKKQMAQYIASLELPVAEAKKWFVRYGLSLTGN